MRPLDITEQAFADLVDESEILHRIILGSIMTTIGTHDDIGDWCVTQTLAGFTLISGRPPSRYFDGPDGMEGDTIAEAIAVVAEIGRRLDRLSASRHG